MGWISNPGSTQVFLDLGSRHGLETEAYGY